MCVSFETPEMYTCRHQEIVWKNQWKESLKNMTNTSDS